jgi:hypothetical protein
MLKMSTPLRITDVLKWSNYNYIKDARYTFTEIHNKAKILDMIPFLKNFPLSNARKITDNKTGETVTIVKLF